MTNFNKETSTGRIADKIVKDRELAMNGLRDSLAGIFTDYYDKYDEFPALENDNAIFAFMAARPPLKNEFNMLDLNRNATMKLFQEAMNIAEERVKQEKEEKE